MEVHRQIFFLHIPGKDNPCPLRGRGHEGNSPPPHTHTPGAGGNILVGRNTEVGTGVKDGYTDSTMRLTECCVCQKLIHKQMLIL